MNCHTDLAAGAPRNRRAWKGRHQKMWIILLVMLGVYSYWDIRDRKLPVVWVVIGILMSASLGVVYNIRSGNMDIWRSIVHVLQGMFPGVLLILFALALKGKMGCGDGMVLIIIGSLVGIESGLIIWTVALGLSFIYSCILLIVRKKGKDYCFPFIPFYFLGAIIVFGVQLTERFVK